MGENIARIKSALDFNELDIAEEIGDFEIVQENNKAVIIETEYGEKHKAFINKMTDHLNIEPLEEGRE